VRARIETWKRIAAHLERSERWCRDMAKRPVRPLPVGRMGGIVVLMLDDLERWLRIEHQSPRVAYARKALRQVDSKA
jgi:hypothetical protein